MGGREVLILCVSVINAVQGSHMQGGSMSFRAREKYSNGWLVDFKYKSAFNEPSYGFSWSCLSGNCGNQIQNTIVPVENRTSSPRWYQNEGYIKRRVSIDKPFQLRESSCCWVYNVNFDGGWELVTAVDLGTRSDTKKPNTSPVTTVIPILRIPRNCATSIKLLAHDPDEDLVTCRYGYYSGECGVCSQHFYVDGRSCVIHFPSGKNTGSYVMEMVLEDFPNKNIHLTYYDRTVVYKYSFYHRKTREAPNESERYWWGATTDVTETIFDDTTEFTDFVTDVTTTYYEMLMTTEISLNWETTTFPYPETTANHVSETEDYTGHFVTSEAITEYPDNIQTTLPETATNLYTTEAITEYFTNIQTTLPETTVEPATIFYTMEATTEDFTNIQTTLPETTVEPTTDFYTTEATTEYFTNIQTTLPETTVEPSTIFYTTEATTEYPNNIQTTIPETTVEPTTDFYTTEAITEYFGNIQTTLPGRTVVPTQHFSTIEQTTVFQETITETEAVTIPYETTAWDFYPTIYPDYTNALSRIPLQFLIEATNPAPTCAYGEYRPRFLSPTPIHGTKLLVNTGKIFQLHLTAHAAYERIADFRVSGLPGMTKTFKSTSQTNTRSMVVEWTPKEDSIGEHVPVCFVAETTNGYQSELRCVVVVVGPSKLAGTTLTCHENTMTLVISKTTNPELNKIQFRLNDPKCLVSSNSTHFIASVGYNSCGTVTEETAENIVFKNTVTNYDTSAVITRANGISIPFNCSFPKKNRVSASFRAQKADYVFTEAGFGNFTYKFQFFTDNQFVAPNTLSPFEVILKEMLYMQIQVSSSVPNVELFVESCKATPHDNPSDPIFYDIINNGCIRDNTVVVYPGSKLQYRFAMEAFAFIGNYPEVYINCVVILCKTGATNTRCTQGCITRSMEASSKHRQRRSLVSESQQHFISQGPLTMKKETPTGEAVKETSVVNGNTLVIALSVMGTVALISITLNIYMKRARTAAYQRLNTQDF